MPSPPPPHHPSSPRTWGCFSLSIDKLRINRVFPTHVGVFLQGKGFRCSELSLPHARGGVSTAMAQMHSAMWSSPRTWGCFRHGSAPSTSTGVFPTHVGVFLPPPPATVPPLVFPTHVGVFPSEGFCAVTTIGLPHARGGVSVQAIPQQTPRESSPRTWGCFSKARFVYRYAPVFPTHVGVFLTAVMSCGVRLCLPHARGGVSHLGRLHSAVLRSSPRTWGCF